MTLNSAEFAIAIALIELKSKDEKCGCEMRLLRAKTARKMFKLSGIEDDMVLNALNSSVDEASRAAEIFSSQGVCLSCGSAQLGEHYE